MSKDEPLTTDAMEYGVNLASVLRREHAIDLSYYQATDWMDTAHECFVDNVPVAIAAKRVLNKLRGYSGER